MSKGVLALTKDGRITYCVAPIELRGIGNCNHIKHQDEGQSVDEFIESIQDSIKEEGSDDNTSAENTTIYYSYDIEEHNKIVSAMPDNEELLTNLVKKYGLVEDPNWETIIREIENPFVIGSEEDGTYEEAELIDFQQIVCEDRINYNLKAKYKFRGNEYELDLGEVPIVQDDGTIDINGNKWRPLPVVEQRKAGVISYYNNILIMQENGHVGIVVPRDPDSETVKIYGKLVNKEDVLNYWKNGDISGLNSGQIWALDHIDPIAFERFPSLKEDLNQLLELEPDEPGDLTDRRVIRYEDMVQRQISLQFRRMGVTFRTNLAKRAKLYEQGKVVENPESNTEYSEEELDEYFPLFYQVNLTENIRKDLIGRSNVQNADGLNPISALTQSQKISFTGPGGFNKDKAPYELRLPHPTHKGLIDPLVASSGKNVGLTACASSARINEKRFLEPKGEENSLSPSDFIPYKYHNDPSRANMACAHLTQACPIVGGEDPIITTPAWDHIKGAKIGLNLRTAYVSDPDCFEDAVKISESAAKKMATVQTQQYKVYDQKELENLRPGTRVERKDNVAGMEIRFGGIIKNVTNDGFEVETVYDMTVGDKLSNRHGSKSVVSRIVPDHEMPQIINEETGELVPAEIVMTPLGVVGRKNLAQIIECNEAAEKVGLQQKSNEENQKPRDRINKTTNVISRGKKIEATSGVTYILRLNHISEKKLSSYADELDASKEPKGARLGNMESILLSTDDDRLKILNYLRHQEARDTHNKLNHLLKSIGVKIDGVNF